MKRIGQIKFCLIGASLAVYQEATAQDVRSSMRVNIVVDSSGEARVHERYRVPRDTGGIRLQLLDRPCARVRDVVLRKYRDTIPLAGTRKGPWQIYSDTTDRAYNADSSGFEVTYAVSLQATSADIPVLHLTRPIPRREGEREGAVELSVNFDGDRGGVVGFPALAWDEGGNSWSGIFVAAPSFVRVARRDRKALGAGECPAVDARLDDGGLSWRFWTLVLIMAAWVPIYLAWARRTSEPHA
jgi:hypothetical protein